MDGVTNRVVDCLTCYYETGGPGNQHLDHEFMSSDMRLDPDGDLLPVQWYVELCTAAARWSHCLAEQVEQ